MCDRNGTKDQEKCSGFLNLPEAPGLIFSGVLVHFTEEGQNILVETFDNIISLIKPIKNRRQLFMYCASR